MADLNQIAAQAKEESSAAHPAMADLWARSEIEIRLESASSGAVKLSALIVSDRARKELPGAGSLALSALCSACDRAGAPIELLAKPLPKPHIPGSTPSFIPLSKLVEFYRRHGFKQAPGHASATSVKMRRP